MQKPPLDPDVADAAPTDLMLTPYDHQHTVTYLRLLDADAEAEDWQELARIVCISIPFASRRALGKHSKATCRARHG
jgi:hypothetical protein